MALGAVAVVVAVVLSATVALGRGGGASATRPAPGEPAPPVAEEAPTSTTMAPTTIAPPAAAATTAAARPATTAPAPTRRHANTPVYVNGVPQVKAVPGTARVGARVRVEGYGFTGAQWAAPNAPLWLALSGGCGLYAQAEHSLRVTSGGRLAGELTVPAGGECPQSDRGDVPVVAGRYRIAFSCTACFIGELKVVASPRSATTCRDVAFAPHSDDMASSIRAWNVPCPEAEALVRKVGDRLGYNGDATVQSGGFRCVRTGREDGALPAAFYECTDGPKRVTFTRT